MDCVPFIEMVPSLDTSALSNRSLSAEKTVKCYRTGHTLLKIGKLVLKTFTHG
jgi:hypothetical protein